MDRHTNLTEELLHEPARSMWWKPMRVCVSSCSKRSISHDEQENIFLFPISRVTVYPFTDNSSNTTRLTLKKKKSDEDGFVEPLGDTTGVLLEATAEGVQAEARRCDVAQVS